MKTAQQSESFHVAALLALAGGALDAYTYLCRGGVFANAETGNIVLLGVCLAGGNWRGALRYLAPVASFALGVLAAEQIKGICRDKAGRLHWRHMALGAEIALLLLASFLPTGELDPLVNILVAFVCALQVETFRKVRGNAFASTMCTGNLRSGTESLYQAARDGDRRAAERGACYYGVIACFIAGAALSGALCPYFPQRAILLAAAFQTAAFVQMIRLDRRG